MVSAAVALVVLGWLIFRGSTHVPLGWFFGATSVLLALLAVVLVGKGIAALQEGGILSVDPLSFPAVPAVGLYPSWQGLGLQILVMLACAGVFAYTRYSARAAR